MSNKVFPSYMTVDIPEGACEQTIDVYRICKTGTVEKGSFLSSYEEYEQRNDLDSLDLDDPGSYSVSGYEKRKDARRSLMFFTKKEPRAVPALGQTEPSCGPCQRTRERIKGKKGSHVDWWLYCDAKPWISFKEVTFDDVK